MQLTIPSLFLLLAVANAATSNLKLPCRMPSKPDSPTPCFPSDDDCCPGFKCLPKDGTNSCQPDASFDAAVSHLMVSHATALGGSLVASLDAASAKVAAADKALEAQIANVTASLDAAKETTSNKTADAMDKLKAKVQQGMDAFKAKHANMTSGAADLADKVKDKADAILKKIYADMDKNATTTSVTPSATAATVVSHKASSTKDAKDTSAASPSAGMDWKSFVPATGGAGGASAGAGFDWSNFTSVASTPSTSKAAVANPGAGFDWKKFSPAAATSTTSKAAAANPGAGFDWKKFSPAAATATTSKAADVEPATAPPQPPAPVEGAKGGPCGKTNFKNFKPCDTGLKCEAAPAASMGWAPGTCVDDTTTKKNDSPSANSAVGGFPMGAGAQPNPGELGGPCGKSSFMDFGVCDPGLVCATPTTGGSFSPGKCAEDPAAKKATSKVDAKTTNAAAAASTPSSMFGGMDGGFDISKFDGMPAMKTTYAMFAATLPDMASVDDTVSFAAAAADDADKMAAAAAKAADALSAQLKASAKSLQDAADKLRAKADALRAEHNMTTTTTTNMASEVIDGQTVADNSGSSMSWYLGFMFTGLVVGTVVMMKKKNSHGYDSINGGESRDWGNAL